jgi:hypothetical protein
MTASHEAAQSQSALHEVGRPDQFPVPDGEGDGDNESSIFANGSLKVSFRVFFVFAFEGG